MKALTVQQPWASLIASGAKCVETRTWRTPYRGPLAIHAAAGLDFDRAALARDLGMSDLPRGRVLCIADLVDCRPLEEFVSKLMPVEQGYSTDGRFGWLLENVRPVAGLPMARGMLGLWEWMP